MNRRSKVVEWGFALATCISAVQLSNRIAFADSFFQEWHRDRGAQRTQDDCCDFAIPSSDASDRQSDFLNRQSLSDCGCDDGANFDTTSSWDARWELDSGHWDRECCGQDRDVLGDTAHWNAGLRNGLNDGVCPCEHGDGVWEW